MAIARDTTAANIKPLEGAIVRRYTAGTTVAAGELVTMQTDGYVDPTNTGAVQNIAGVALQGVTTGQRVDVVVFGPVQCLTGATVGATVYGTDTAGEPGETAGTKTTIAGWAESATVLFVNPQTVSLS